MKYYLAICLLFISISSQAALNKWIDAEGKVHYSDSAPPDVKVKTLRGSATPDSSTPAAAEAAPQTLAERDAEWKKSQKAKEAAAKKASQEQETAQIKQKNCESARSNLAGYENSRRIVQYNPSGERIFLDDTARAQKTDEARQAVSTYCN